MARTQCESVECYQDLHFSMAIKKSNDFFFNFKNYNFKLTIMLCDVNFGCSQIILIAKPACVFISVSHDRFRVTVYFNASDMSWLVVGKLSKENRYMDNNLNFQKIFSSSSCTNSYYADWWAFEWKCVTCKSDQGNIGWMSPFLAQLIATLSIQ